MKLRGDRELLGVLHVRLVHTTVEKRMVLKREYIISDSRHTTDI